MRYVILAGAVLAAHVCAAAEPDAEALRAASTALQTYVAKPDDSYADDLHGPRPYMYIQPRELGESRLDALTTAALQTRS